MKTYESSRVDEGYDPGTDPTWRRITRVEGKLVSRDATRGPQAKWVSDIHAREAGAPMHVVTPDGRDLIVYAGAHTEGLMTAKLQEGKSYVFIAREHSLSQNPADALSFDALSYDAVAR